MENSRIVGSREECKNLGIEVAKVGRDTHEMNAGVARRAIKKIKGNLVA